MLHTIGLNLVPTGAYLKIARREAGMLIDAGEHARADFFSIVKSERVIRPASSRKNSMGAFLPLDAPTDGENCFEYFRGFSRVPLHSRTCEKLERKKTLVLHCQR